MTLTEVLESHTLFVERYKPSDPRLGRHVLHDSRSLQYQVEPRDAATLKSVRHMRRIPILDQGQLGSCTGNAAVGVLGTDPFVTTVPSVGALTEAFAVKVYSDATKLDPYGGTYPPTDTGSDGLSVAKVLKNLGLISGYQHATSLAAVLTALQDKPVIVGTKWLSSMFTPASDGRINISGSNEGGHEYEIDEIDVENRRLWMDQSWGQSFGLQGRAYFTWDDFGQLLADRGDCTVFTPNTQPAPTPTPPTPPAPPAPTDWKKPLLEHLKASVALLEASS
jgi:hypothetical protein